MSTRFFLFIASCLCLLADTPENKLDSSIEQMYQINLFEIKIRDWMRWQDIAPDDEGITGVVLDYNGSCPFGSKPADPGSGNGSLEGSTAPAYETNLSVIPFEEENFKLSDKLAYERYFTDTNEIILSWEMANAMYPTNPEKMLDEHIVKTFLELITLSLKS